METHNLTSIKRSILWPLVVSYAAIILIFFVAVYVIEVNNKTNESQKTLNNIEKNFLRKIDETAQLISSQIYVIESSQCIQSALTESNIDNLRFCSEQFFSILEDMFLVTEINYYSNDKKYLLSINQNEEEKKNEIVSDYVSNRAINTNELTYGLELTTNKELRLITSKVINSKALTPVYVEIKLNMDLVLDTLEDIENVSLLVLTEENEQDLKLAQQGHRHGFNLNKLYHHTIVYGGNRLLDSDYDKLDNISEQLSSNKMSHFSLGNDYYTSGSFSLLNEGGRHIGHFIILRNSTDDVNALNLLFSKLIVIITILSLICFFIFNRYLKRIDTRLNESYLALVNEIEERKIAQEKIKAQDELIMTQSRHAAMGEMISMIAHQWRQPISVIAMEANNMLADIEFDDIQPDAFSKDARNIIEQTQYLSKTIDDFRNFFRPGKKKEQAIPQQIMEECFSIVGKSLENNNIEIIKNYRSERSLFLYSRELLQVIINLIKNAKEALMENRETERKLIIDIFELDEKVHISITDNAGGIKEDNQNKIFEPYFSTKDKKSGTGLGLYMSKTIIEEHLGGEMLVKNTNDGVKFILQLPLEANHDG
ncbi:MAG: HAMP domain-containing histidine kinase [Gammaproteobacteria bacterium]|nr:HAMP domain-containing histidine kinase [Gammaproteobacteria bacterium]